MKALIYLLKTTVINYFKRIKEKPQKALSLVVVVIWITIMFFPNRRASHGNTSIVASVSIFVIFTVVTFLYSLYSGTKKVSSKFDMSDVNLIFVSPIRPQTVMLYGIVKKIALEFFASLYILLQISNFMNTSKVTATAQLLFYVSYILYQLVLCNILKLFIFVMCNKFSGLGTIIRDTIKAFIIFIVGIATLDIIKHGAEKFFKGDIVNVANTITYSGGVKYIPIFGWMREMAFQVMTSLKLSYLIYMFCIILLSFVLLYITYNVKIDFYEEMLTSAEVNQNRRDIKSGRGRKKSFVTRPFRNVALNLKDRYGAEVIFFKHMNEYSKKSFLFLINTYSIILLLVSVLLGIFEKRLDIKILFLYTSSILFFSAGLGGRIYNEITNYFIFILPDSAQKKLFYGIASSLIKIFTDAVIIFVPFGILSRKSILEVILCIICYVAWGGMLSYSGLLAFRIAQFLGFTGSLANGLIFMFFQMIITVPAVLIVLISVFLIKDFSGYFIYLALLIYAISASALISLGCVGIFDNMEIEGTISR